MMFADFPPISSDTRFTDCAPSSITRLPARVEPVNETLSTSGCVAIASPTTGPSPVTRLNTPFGSPASWMMSARMKALIGATSLGFNTTVQPAASAGATFSAIWNSGKFHGVIAPTTPTGSLTTSELPISSCHAYDVAWVALSTNAPVGNPTWMGPVRVRGIPTSWLITSAISSLRAWSPSVIFCRKAARSLGGVADHAETRGAAASTARSMSAGVPAGIVANTSSVVESITSRVSDADGLTHAPSM